MFVRGRYGHGGRIGYDKEWRADPALSGGGELIDQGVHLIDLARWFLGDFTDGRAASRTPTSGTCRSTTTRSCCCGRRASRRRFLHVSCTEWKNLFSFEIYGRDGKLHDRRARRQLRRRAARLLPDAAGDGTAGDDDLGVPAGDHSWALEFAEFLEDIRLGRAPVAGPGRRARGAGRSSSRIYRSESRTR